MNGDSPISRTRTTCPPRVFTTYLLPVPGTVSTTAFRCLSHSYNPPSFEGECGPGSSPVSESIDCHHCSRSCALISSYAGICPLLAPARTARSFISHAMIALFSSSFIEQPRSGATSCNRFRSDTGITTCVAFVVDATFFPWNLITSTVRRSTSSRLSRTNADMSPCFRIFLRSIVSTLCRSRVWKTIRSFGLLFSFEASTSFRLRFKVYAPLDGKWRTDFYTPVFFWLSSDHNGS